MSGHLDIVHQVYKAFVAADLPTLLDLITDDAEFVPPISSRPSSLPGWGRTWRGRHGGEQSLTTLATALEFEIFQPDEFIADGDTVVVLGHERCRVRATGRIVEVSWTQIFTFRDGRVCRHRE